MGLIGDIIDGSMRASERKRRREERRLDREIAARAPKSKLQKLLTNLALVTLLLAIALLIIYFTGVAGRSMEFALIVAIVFIITALLGLSIPWAVNIQKKENTKLSIIFLSFVGVCAVFWIISAFLVYNIVKQVTLGNEPSQFSASIVFIQVSLFISLQFAFANMIATNITKYKKDLLVFQIIMYISHVFLDFYLSLLVWSFKITESGGLEFGDHAYLLLNPIMLTVLAIALVYIVISNVILTRIQRRKNRGLIGTIAESYHSTLSDSEQSPQTPAAQEAQPSTEDRLAKLKEMYDKQIITQEEYEAKRKDIIDKM